jgi:hypothetical protein
MTDFSRKSHVKWARTIAKAVGVGQAVPSQRNTSPRTFWTS